MNKRSRGLMQEVVRKMKEQECNRRIAKGVLRTCTMLKASVDTQISVYLMDVIRWIDRCRVYDRWPGIVRCLEHVWDATWKEQYLVSVGVESLHSFFRTNGDLIRMTVEQYHKHYQNLLTATGDDYVAKSADLNAACESKLGNACWGWAKPKAAAQVVKMAITKHLKPPPGGRFYDQEWIDQFVENCMVDIRDHKAEEACSPQINPFTVFQ